MKRTIVRELIAVHNLHVVNDRGEVRAAIGTDDEGNALMMLGNPDKDQGMVLHAREDGSSYVNIMGRHNYSSIQIGIDKNGEPSVKIVDAENRYRVYLGLYCESATLRLFDPQGKERIRALVPPQGDPWIAILDDEGFEIDAMGADDEEDDFTDLVPYEPRQS